LQFFVTSFSRFRSQTSGNTGGQYDTLRLSCNDANWIEHVESKVCNTDALPTHFMMQQVLRCFLNLGPRALEMLRAPGYLNPARHADSDHFMFLEPWSCKSLGADANYLIRLVVNKCICVTSCYLQSHPQHRQAL